MTQQANLPDAQVAYNTLYEAAHARVFFQKCAAAGYEPQNDAQARWMLETAGKLRLLDQHVGVQKQAQEHDPYYQASNRLDQLLARYGIQDKTAQDQHELGLRQAAVDLAGDPTLYNSILALKTAEAQQIQTQYAAWQQEQSA